ncbi:ribonuclease HI [Egibacter rhizosphaerae]|uniref:ribonuclease H n=1 Tax=Egibacter rhizosphaerae TaxID=1670831 RepID=A0A411YKJ3_9ACTN|nr:ribonuclease H [Egibacter rhizosphaerae]QBI21707.1 ribonuclease HI [Egibacter rhizosphaerae]
MTEPLVCTDCGASFTLPDRVVAQYPNWRPARCRRCHGRRAGGSGGADPKGAPSKQGGARRRGGSREADRTTAEVLEHFDEGPDTGVFTDGAADPNPGPGGWGAVYVLEGEIVDEACGSEAHTTNNRMELTALIAGYDLVPPGEAVTVFTDSRLAVDTITKWAPGWKARGWRRKNGEVENLDLVKALYERATARPEIELRWIRGHAGSRWNEYADALATAYRRSER